MKSAFSFNFISLISILKRKTLVLSRWHAGWKGTASRSIEKVLRHFEIVGDPQMLASMVCVLSSASKDVGGYGTLLPGGLDNVSKYDRYLTSYAEQLYQWSAHGVRTEIISHVRGGENQPSSNDIATVTPVCQGVKVNQLSKSGWSSDKQELTVVFKSHNFLQFIESRLAKISKIFPKISWKMYIS